ncbi:MAG: hypothetical protein K0U68_03055 [Gammaproteobacteria bacterium]|nr:hypothetical protein [Gammaproteobacteria bacterium]
MFYRRVAFLVLVLLVATPHAHEVDNRHGVVPDNKSGFVFEAGITVTGQFSTAKRVNNEIIASFDLFGNATLGSG